MMNFTKKATLVFTMVVAFSLVGMAQTAFYSNEFSDGDLPAGWTTEDATLQGAEWTWCDDPDQGVGAGCVVNWANYYNQHDNGFFSTTADNGFLLMDSDKLGGLPLDHIALLNAAPIDCSAQAEVWLKLEALIGVFGLPTTGNAVLNVSNNGVDYTTFNLYDIDTGTRWSENPELTILDISSVAAGQSTVYLQWSWTGNYEYYWLIDDLQLFDGDPSIIFIPPNDMRVNSNFFATAPNVLWPLSQTEEFGFLADVENVGSTDQTGVSLNITIEDPNGDVAYTEDLAYGLVEVDTLVENVLFDGDGFTPSMMGLHTGTYTLTQDNVDDNPDNNVQTFTFEMTENVWAKHVAWDDATRPADANWEDPNEGWSWAYGNEYYCVNGDNLYFETITFTVEESDGGSGNTVFLKIYSWEDENADGLVNPDERGNALGLVTYVTTGTEDRTTPITLPITTLAGEQIPLESNTRYLAVIEYITDTPGDELLFGVSEVNDYSAQVFRSETIGLPRYAGVLGVNGDLDVEDYSTVGFGADIVPAIAVTLGFLEDVNSTQLSEANTINLFPNPAQQILNVDLDLVQNMEQVDLFVTDITGKIIQVKRMENIQRQQVELNLEGMSNGTYFLQVVTNQGVRTQTFVIQK
ncbi:MAG: T9SS type A sorting domain-containing protein [Saprospiraceae bacterium]|nr:T9SS type A sorting domain-containing protein [Saprospiraceae bacterium]